MKAIQLYLIIFIFLLQSCAKATGKSKPKSADSDGAGVNSEIVYETNYWNKEFIDKFNNELSNKLNQIIDKCDSDKVNTETGCLPEVVYPGNANPLKESEGQRVLLLDDFSMSLAAYTRYRDRVLENIIETDDGDFISDNGQIVIPHLAKEILLDTFNNTNISKLPAELLNPSRNLFFQKLYPALSQVLFRTHSQGHGTNIFNYVANNSPNSQFVMAYASDEKIERIFCNNDSDDKKINDIDTLFLKQSNELNTYIQKYNINFMLLSRGISKDYFDGNRPYCKTFFSENLKRRINKSYYNNYLNNISKNVIIFQSNAHADYNVNINDPNYYSDCKNLENRIRVGVVNDLTTSIPYFGSRDSDKIYVNSENLNTSKCTDIYINIAVEKQRPYRFAKGVVSFSDFGVGSEPPIGLQVASSYTSPIALTYALYLKTINPYLSNDDLLKQIRVLQGKSFIVLDPGLNKQLPIYKFGYLK